MSDSGEIDGHSRSEPVVQLENISFAYNGQLVLKDVNLSIAPQDFVWIVGPNGGGKTTLLKLILGLLHPRTGDIEVFGGSPRKSRPKIGYMPQQVSLDKQFPATAMDVVLMGRLGHGRRWGLFRIDDRKAAAAALETVGLAEYRQAPFSDLSGGQQRRLFIARALAGDPRLLLLDEPTANLDPAVQGELYELLRDLNNWLTIILVSHDPAFVSEFVKKVVCVKRTVDVHPTGEVCGDILGELYAPRDMRIVRHDREYRNGADRG